MRFFGSVLFLATVLFAGQAESTAELSAHDEPAEFKSRVNLVTVPVVVRDGQGRAVGNLKKEDFQLFDKGKAQVISKFEVETPGKPVAAAPVEAVEKAPGETSSTAPAPVIPQRYVAYLFDDIHTDFADLVRARDAADKHIASTLSPLDRAAIFTTSGQHNVDFTNDRAKLHDALMKLQPRPIARMQGHQCPDVTFYMADAIVNQNDSAILQALTADTITCANLDGPPAQQQAQMMVKSEASRAIQAGEQETHVAYTVLSDVVRRLSAMPGQRMILLASAGFLTLADERFEESQVIERAVHSNVIISALDARGLYTDSTYDASRGMDNPQAMATKSIYLRQEALAVAGVMEELADGTGGTFVQNTNDLTAAYARLGSPPEFIYILGFSPQNLKFDGSFHRLKVGLKPGMKLTLQARRGYYAPKHAVDPAEEAKQEISDELFSQEQVRDLPVDLHTQFFKSSDTDAQLSVLAHLDLKGIQFRKADGRNNDVLTVVAGIFDNNGNFLKGTEKTLTLRLRDETLASHMQSGVTVRTSFNVKPGTYLVRLVVRDAEGQQMAAQSGSVEIPY